MKHKRVNEFTYLIVFIILAGILLANGCAIETENQPQISTDEPKATDTQVIPTETEVPVYIIKDPLEAFTPAQEALNQSPEALAKQERFQRWLDYWVQFDNRPFAPGSVDIHKKYVYNDPQNPTEVIMLLEVGGPDYKNKLFGVPMNEEGFVDFPPPVTGTSIQPGLGPLEINPNKDNTVLSVDQGTLVRKEFNFKGDIVERLVAGHWEAVEQYPIDMEKLSNPPQSYEDFVNNLDKFVQAPSPDGSDENFQEFVTWYNETLFQKTLGGDLEKLPVNYEAKGIDIGTDMIIAYNTVPAERHSLPYFFYFKDRDGVPYPCYVVTVATPEYQQTFTMVRAVSSTQMEPLFNVPDMVAAVYQEINSFSSLQLLFYKGQHYSDVEGHLVNQFSGFPSTVGQIPIYFGGLNFNNK